MLSQIQSESDLFGLPLPSNDQGFVIVVIIHILLSFGAVIIGLVAMFILVIIRWPHNNHLLLIGTLTAVLVFAGRKLAQIKKPKWARLHTICMGCSYILLLTGFYVDNGEHLPFWKQFPKWFFYILPTLIGVPIIFLVLRKHPLTNNSF